MSKTTVSSDLLQSFDVISELRLQVVGNDLGELAVLDILLSVEEVVGDVELTRVSDNGDDLVDFLSGQFTSSENTGKKVKQSIHQKYAPLLQINVSLLEDDVGETSTNTLNLGQSILHSFATFDVCVSNTKNVLETSFSNNQGLHMIT